MDSGHFLDQDSKVLCHFGSWVDGDAHLEQRLEVFCFQFQGAFDRDPALAEFAGGLKEKEKDELLRQSHFLLHTSMREGWGLNVIEANAMGTTTVVYPVAGLVESTLHDETGIVADAETPDAIADALVKILAHPEKYESYRVKAWERAKTFHWSRVLETSSAWLEAQARRNA